MVSRKDKERPAGISITVGSEKIESEDQVKLLWGTYR